LLIVTICAVLMRLLCRLPTWLVVPLPLLRDTFITFLTFVADVRLNDAVVGAFAFGYLYLHDVVVI